MTTGEGSLIIAFHLVKPRNWTETVPIDALFSTLNMVVVAFNAAPYITYWMEVRMLNKHAHFCSEDSQNPAQSPYERELVK